jgi:phosphohistidine swiveling domain-containing protein
MATYSTEFLRFELPAFFYFNSIHIVVAPTLTYKNRPVSHGWYGAFTNADLSLVKVPLHAWLDPGNYFLQLILQNDQEFRTYYFDLVTKMVACADRLQVLNRNDLESGTVTSLSVFYPEYKNTFGYIIGMGYPLDTALEQYTKEQSLDTAHVPVYGRSFVQKEQDALYEISQITSDDERDEALYAHSLKYSWLLNNYTGEHRVSREYFQDRLLEVSPSATGSSETKKPSTIEEWIGFLVYVRDERKRLNMIVNGMLDRYLRDQCKQYQIAYTDAVMLSVDEFEERKERGVNTYGHVRYVHTDSEGIHAMTNVEVADVFGQSAVEDTEITGTVANKGRVTGVVKIILQTSDFAKMQQGDIIVASMTRPEFAPIFSKAAAIITNEGGITCHAAIISRELKIPCVIGTKIATQVLHDGDLGEVDAQMGVVRIVSRSESEVIKRAK